MTRPKSKKRTQRRSGQQGRVPEQPAASLFRRKVVRIGLLGLIVVAVGGAVWVATRSDRTQSVNRVSADDSEPRKPAQGKPGLAPKTLDELLALTPEQLAKVDIARANLLCAEGLPGAEKIDIEHALDQLDDWARRVRFETDRHLYRFQRNPAEYENSEAYFRVLWVSSMLQLDFGVHYNLERVRDVDFTRSQDLFIHGMIDSDNGGTCVSMPVMYIAVGRRLGYPLRLVTTKAHLFFRWDGPVERINFEGSGRGLNTYPDDYYKSWPMKSTDAEVKRNRFLISYSPAEELAVFLSTRGHCLLENGRAKEALAAYTAACKLAPDDPVCQAFKRRAEGALRGRTVAGTRPPRFPEPPMVYGRPSSGRRPDPLAELRRIEAINAQNRRITEGQTRPPTPYGAQSPSPYGPRPSTPYGPQPGSPPPVHPDTPQPYRPPMPGIPPR
ncbi:MAG: hypothetical protein HQ567_30630 [Candidatus Nealsonbacteria bacterium]|nr:hypothetical protein [Candidatus Nealsonbacteria bacterium]